MCKHIVLITVWLKANQSVALHMTSFVCLVAKRDLAETIFVVIISTWFRCQRRSKTDRILAVLWGSCPVSIVSRHVRFTQKEHINNHSLNLLSTSLFTTGDRFPCTLSRWVLACSTSIPRVKLTLIKHQ